MSTLTNFDGKYNPYAPPAAVIAPRLEDSMGATGVPAQRGTRWWARVIDQLLLAATAIPAVGVVYGAGEDLGWGLGVLCALFLAYQWYLITTTGQTLAKRWLGIRVVRLNGERLGFLHGVVLREWITTAIAFIPVVGRLFNLADAAAIFGPDRRCVHDQIAGTKVIAALPGSAP
jgi:uncharacterized RDD family membrane protein YckC